MDKVSSKKMEGKKNFDERIEEIQCVDKDSRFEISVWDFSWRNIQAAIIRTVSNAVTRYNERTSKTVVVDRMRSHKFARRSNRNFRANLNGPSFAIWILTASFVNYFRGSDVFSWIMKQGSSGSSTESYEIEMDWRSIDPKFQLYRRGKKYNCGCFFFRAPAWISKFWIRRNKRRIGKKNREESKH